MRARVDSMQQHRKIRKKFVRWLILSLSTTQGGLCTHVVDLKRFFAISGLIVLTYMVSPRCGGNKPPLSMGRGPYDQVIWTIGISQAGVSMWLRGLRSPITPLLTRKC